MVGLEDREVVVWVLGVIVAGFAVGNRRKLETLPHWRVPLCAASLLLVGWTFSILEAWYAPTAFNIVEHVAYLAHSVLMLAWLWTLVGKRKTRLEVR